MIKYNNTHNSEISEYWNREKSLKHEKLVGTRDQAKISNQNGIGWTLRKQEIESNEAKILIKIGQQSNSNLEFSGDASGKESTCHCRGSRSIPGSGRSPGGGNGNPFQ